MVPKHVLVVDDEDIIIEVETEILQTLDYNVTGVTNPLKALELLNSAGLHFDLLVVDESMPEMTGLELAAMVHKQHPLLPVFLCTGHSERTLDAALKGAGIKELLIKPVTLDRWTEVMEKLFGSLQLSAGTNSST